MRALTRALDSAGSEGPGRAGGVVFLAGEPGVGKTRLASELADVAASRGFLVLVGRAVQASSPVPLRPVHEALAPVARTTAIPDVPELAEYRPVLSLVVPGWGRAGEAEAEGDGARDERAREGQAEISPLILGEALLRLLVALGGSGRGGRAGPGTLLVLEDLQFADPETLAIVEYLADNLAGERVLCVGTLRDSEPSAALDAMRSVHARRAAILVEVPRLAEDDVGVMAAACLGQEVVPRQILGRLLADCDGLPFAVEEILAAAVSSGELVPGKAGWRVREGVETAVPVSIAESVRSRLARLGPQVVNVLVAAAVLGRQFDWTLLPPIAGVPETGVLAALHRAWDVQLIEPDGPSQVVFRFRHSLTRDVVISDLSPSSLAKRSAAAAAAIEVAHPGLPGEWCELAAGLHEAAGQSAQAASLLLMSGRRALHGGALASAAVALGMAREVAGRARQAQPRLVAEIDDALTTVHMLTGDCDQLVRVAERLLAELDVVGTAPDRKALIRLRVARSLSEGDRIVQAEQQVAVARALAAGSPDPTLGGWADAVEARCAIDAGEPDRAIELAHRALAAAEAAELVGGSAEAACEALEVIGRRERVRDTAAASTAFERACQIATSRALPVWRIRALHELGTIDMLTECGSGRLAQARRLAKDAGAISTVTVLDLQLANAWSLGTDLDRALSAAARSQEAARRLRMRRVEAMAWGAQACILAIRDGRDRVAVASEQAERIAPGDEEVLTTTWGEAKVTAAIVDDDLAGALDASTTAISHARREPLTAPSLAWGYWPLLSAVLGEDGHAALGEAVAAGAEVACWNAGCLAYARAVLAGRDGQPGVAAEFAARAEARFARNAPWWNHIMHRLVAPAAFRDGWGEPAIWLRAAVGDLEASGFQRLASACRGLLRGAGERVPRSGRGRAPVPDRLRRLGVTSREMDVFLLIGQGSSTAEIASRLHISPKTVETHVASLASKAGLAGRRELAVFAARTEGS